MTGNLGVKCLLLNNLGVYGGCRVLFDSLLVPCECISCNSQKNSTDKIDLSFAKECFEPMLSDMLEKKEINPTLREIVDQFDENEKRPIDTPFSLEKPDSPGDLSRSTKFFEDEESMGHDVWDFHQDDDDDAAVGAEDSNSGNPTFSNHAETVLLILRKWRATFSLDWGTLENTMLWLGLSIGSSENKDREA